jgi:phage internal scaffolding protein
MADITIRVNLRHKPTVGIVFSEPSLTQQHFKDECDIDRILKKYSETGFLVNPLEARRPAKWGDFSSVADYQASMNRLVQVQEAFDALPSRVRERFRNDPMQMLAFLEDPANKDEAVKLGLVVGDAPVANAGTSSQPPQEASNTPLPVEVENAK